MTQEFHSLTAFAARLLVMEVAVQKELRVGLKEAAQHVETQAKGELGTYQPAVGPFSAWQELAESTKEDRVRKGFTENDPLLRSGELRESISHEVHGLEAEIGTPREEGEYLELGTSKMPPRPFLGPALIHSEKAIHKILGHAVVRGMVGGHAIAQIGYEGREV